MSKATINKQLNIRNNGNPFVGQSDLAVEHWDKDILGIGSPYTYSGANGETWSNAWGTDNCKKSCKGLFALSSETELRKGCEKTCGYECNYKSKCPDSYSPTRESVCLKAGLDKDCQKTTSSSNLTIPLLPSNEGGTGAGGEGGTGAGGEEPMSTGAKAGIILGILAVLGTAGYLMFRNK